MKQEVNSIQEARYDARYVSETVWYGIPRNECISYGEEHYRIRWQTERYSAIWIYVPKNHVVYDEISQTYDVYAICETYRVFYEELGDEDADVYYSDVHRDVITDAYDKLHPARHKFDFMLAHLSVKGVLTKSEWCEEYGVSFLSSSIAPGARLYLDVAGSQVYYVPKFIRTGNQEQMDVMSVNIRDIDDNVVRVSYKSKDTHWHWKQDNVKVSDLQMDYKYSKRAALLGVSPKEYTNWLKKELIDADLL